MNLIQVEYQPSKYWSDGTVDNKLWWECAHLATMPDVIEHYDHYRDAESGVPQPLYYENIEQCLDCDAWYRPKTEEWYSER